MCMPGVNIRIQKFDRRKYFFLFYFLKTLDN
jgi:hypothetical protein